MKFSEFFSPKVSKADQDREAQQELEAALSRAQPPTEAQRTWVIPLQETPEWAKPQPPQRRSAAPRRSGSPLLGRTAPPAARTQPQDDVDDVAFEDEGPLDQVPLNQVFSDRQRPAAAPRKKAAPAAPAKGASAAPKPARPKSPAASADAESPRPRPPQKRTPPPRRRPPQ